MIGGRQENAHESSSKTESTFQGRNYSAFDAELTHQALNVRLFIRLLKWAKPYKLTLIASSIFVTISAGLSVLLPVLQARVIVDNILVPANAQLNASLPDYYLIDITFFFVDYLEFHPLVVAILFYVSLFIVQQLLSIVQQLTLTSGALKTLRDLRVDLLRL